MSDMSRMHLIASDGTYQHDFDKASSHFRGVPSWLTCDFIARSDGPEFVEPRGREGYLIKSDPSPEAHCTTRIEISSDGKIQVDEWVHGPGFPDIDNPPIKHLNRTLLKDGFNGD